MSRPADLDTYYRTIEEEFNRRRGAPMLLSPRDWSLIGSWRESGVPLRIVLQGMNNAFDAFERRRPAARRINSLSYCRQEVLTLHELYLGLRGAGPGGSGSAPKAAERRLAIGRHLGRLARRAREAMAISSEAHLDPLVVALARAVAELKSIRREIKGGSFDPEQLEEALQRLDETLLRSAQVALPSEEVRALEGESERTLREHQERMSRDVLATTRRAVLGRLLRRRCHLPRMTLFD